MGFQQNAPAQALNKIQLGIAGEHYVAAELCRRGLIATITAKNTKDIDLLVSNAAGTRHLSVQVKTTSKPGGWLLSQRAETLSAAELYYVFVFLDPNQDTPPEYFLVPSKQVAETVRSGHQHWLQTPGRNGRPHQDNKIRSFSRTEAKEYRDRWDLIMEALAWRGVPGLPGKDHLSMKGDD